MRKFFTILLATALALIVAVAITMYQRGITFSDLNVLRLFSVTAPNKEKTKGPSIPDVKENLSYQQRIDKGNYFFDRGFVSLAVNEFVQAANLEPNRIEPYLKLINSNLKLRDYDKVKRNAKTILKIDPSNTDAYYYLTLVSIRQSNFEEASNLLSSVKSRGLNDPRFDYFRGLLNILQGNHKEAKRWLKLASKELTDDVLSKNVNTLLDSYRDFDFAQAADDLYLSELLARAFNQDGEYELSIALLKDILKTRSDLRDSWIMLGFSYLNLGKDYFALTSFEKAYELDSEWPATQYFLGLTYTELEQPKDAILYLKSALENGFKPRVIAERKLADLYMNTQNYEKAVDIYIGLLKQNENQNNASNYVRPIWLYLDFLNEPDKALDLAKLAVKTFPNSAMSYNLLGWSQTSIKDFRDAEENLFKAIDINPDFAAAYYNLGQLYVAQNQPNTAIEAFKTAYKLDENGSIGTKAAKKYNELLTTSK